MRHASPEYKDGILSPYQLKGVENLRFMIFCFMSKPGSVMGNGHHVVRLEFTSALEMLNFLQVATDHIAYSVGLDEDTSHWVGVAVRESVINAIKHGNRNDARIISVQSRPPNTSRRSCARRLPIARIETFVRA